MEGELTCKAGLHPDEGKGQCKPCKNKRDRDRKRSRYHGEPDPDEMIFDWVRVKEALEGRRAASELTKPEKVCVIYTTMVRRDATPSQAVSWLGDNTKFVMSWPRANTTMAWWTMEHEQPLLTLDEAFIAYYEEEQVA
jgi:hypothetical protein